MPASNTKECFSEFIGQELIGLLFDAFGHDPRGCKTLVFEDGRGLTISSNGSYWIEPVEEIQRAVKKRRRELDRTRGEIEQVLRLAGELRS